MAKGTLTVGTTKVQTTFVFDTGAPSTEIHFGTDIPQSGLSPYLMADGKTISKGTKVKMSAGPWSLTFEAGDDQGKNKVACTTMSENTPGKTAG